MFMGDFKELVLNDTPDVYIKMQRAETKSPYFIEPEEICKHNTYSSKRNRYVERVKKEKEAFNEALHTIIKRRKDRLCSEERRRNERRENTKAFFFALSQWLITLVCILPIGFLDYVGIVNTYSRNIGNPLSSKKLPIHRPPPLANLEIKYCIPT